MEKKINIAELLRGCPKGMELDCTAYDSVSFDKISDDKKATYPIFCYITDEEGNRSSISFTENGCESKRYGAKCVIFPKGKTTWEGFVPPCKFNAGDVLVSEHGNIVLLSHIDSENLVHYHCIITTYDSFRIEEDTKVGVGRYYDCVLADEQQKQRMYDKIKSSGYKYNQSTNKLEKLIEPEFNDGNIVVTTLDNIALISNKNNDDDYKCHCLCIGNNLIVEKLTIYPTRLASEEEKQELFDTIEENGYKWNAETKTLEKLIKPKFKVGDRIRKCGSASVYEVTYSNNGKYLLDDKDISLLWDKQDAWELVPNKFDISTLKPFDKVLVRDNDDQLWTADMFSFKSNNIYPFACVGHYVSQCIPYEGNEHLLGTTDDCDDYYNTWE